MRRYKIEDNRGIGMGKPDMYITLHEGPYTKERILNKTGWNPDSVTITDVTVKFESEE